MYSVEKLFLPYNLCILAQKKGFDEICMAYWEHNKFPSKKIDTKKLIIHYSNFPLIKEEEKIDRFRVPIKNSALPQWAVAAPIYEQIIQWLDKKHSLFIQIEKNLINNEYFGLYVWKLTDESGEEYVRTSKSKNGALKSAIKKSLKLIK